MKKIDDNKILGFLKEKWHGAGCPVCGSLKWGVSSKVFELREFDDGNINMRNVAIFPVIPVTCSNCGNTILISALTSGLMEE